MKLFNDAMKVDSVKNRIEYAMTIRGIKQIDLCQKTGIPKSSMSQYLSGEYEPKQDRIEIIAKALNVNETWLRGYDTPMRPPYDYTQIEEGPQGTMMVSSESPWEEEMMGYFATLDPDEQYAEVQRIKDISNGKLKAGSPGAIELSEGETLLIELFRKVSEDRQELVLEMIKAALENLSK